MTSQAGGVLDLHDAFLRPPANQPLPLRTPRRSRTHAGRNNLGTRHTHLTPDSAADSSRLTRTPASPAHPTPRRASLSPNPRASATSAPELFSFRVPGYSTVVPGKISRGF